MLTGCKGVGILQDEVDGAVVLQQVVGGGHGGVGVHRWLGVVIRGGGVVRRQGVELVLEAGLREGRREQVRRGMGGQERGDKKDVQ